MQCPCTPYQLSPTNIWAVGPPKAASTVKQLDRRDNRTDRRLTLQLKQRWQLHGPSFEGTAEGIRKWLWMPPRFHVANCSPSLSQLLCSSNSIRSSWAQSCTIRAQHLHLYRSTKLRFHLPVSRPLMCLSSRGGSKWWVHRQLNHPMTAKRAI